jgi:hypothetical protein
MFLQRGESYLVQFYGL